VDVRLRFLDLFLAGGIVFLGGNLNATLIGGGGFFSVSRSRADCRDALGQGGAEATVGPTTGDGDGPFMSMSELEDE